MKNKSVSPNLGRLYHGHLKIMPGEKAYVVQSAGETTNVITVPFQMIAKLFQPIHELVYCWFLIEKYYNIVLVNRIFLHSL